MTWIDESPLCCTSSKQRPGQQAREAGLQARSDLRMHLPERYQAGLLPLLIVDEHRGQGALRNLEVVAPHEKALSPFGALPGSGDVVHDPVAPLVDGPHKITAVEGIDADVALGEEPAPQHHSPVDRRGAGINEPASQRAIPVGAHDEVEVP
jgi:hypothetical protein